MASPLLFSFLGALQAALSVLLTLSYGVVAAKYGLIHDDSVNDISQLCVRIFLPALLLTNVGSHLSMESLRSYVPVLVWSFIYPFVSIAIGMAATKVFKLPAWTTPAMAFNNTTSLPLLLITSLASTGILKPLIGADVADSIDRSKSFFLINSMVSNTLTFAVGPRLIDENKPENELGEDADAPYANDLESEADEQTLLLPRPIAAQAMKKAQNKLTSAFHLLPPQFQSFITLAASKINPPLQGAILAVTIGLVPGLHKAFFAKMEEGGWLHVSLTASIKNVGDLFTALQMFVVGGELYRSLGGRQEVSRIPKMGMGLVFAVRFLMWPAVAIPSVYLLAKNTTWLGDDPMVWFVMMLMPVGPPAMMLSALMELKGAPEADKMAIARVLMYFYAVTPVICFAVVGSLKACEAVLDKR